MLEKEVGDLTERGRGEFGGLPLFVSNVMLPAEY